MMAPSLMQVTMYVMSEITQELDEYVRTLDDSKASLLILKYKTRFEWREEPT
jgi:hypothetical protein